MISRFERFSLTFFEIYRYWHKIAMDEMEKYGLKGTHSVYLIALHRHREGITAARLAELCGRDKADVSRMISIMQQKGLVEKSAAGQNQYRALLRLTEAGHTAASLVRLRAAKAVELAGAHIREEDREEFYITLERIAENLRSISEDGLPQ